MGLHYLNTRQQPLNGKKSATGLRAFGRWFVAVWLCLMVPLPSLAQDNPEGGWLFFPEIDYADWKNLEAGGEHIHDHINEGLTPALDVFFSGRYEQLQVLFETYFSEHEQELERLQLGWKVTPANNLWFGRYHNPLGLWNIRYHHGSYLQTSITRPHIVEYEDAGGVLPTHILGGMWEGTLVREDSAWHYNLALGFGPEWEDEEIVAPNLDNLDLAEHKLTTTVALFYQPDVFNDSEFGFFFSNANIADSDGTVGEQSLKIAGVSFDWHISPFQLMGAAVRVEDSVKTSLGKEHGLFGAGYLMLTYRWGANLALFARQGATTNWHDDPYIEHFHTFSNTEKVLGLRYDFGKRHAIKLEYSDEKFHDDSVNHIAVQWSAFFP